jgi:hypothetical protein
MIGSISMNLNELDWLQKWYAEQCDGDWGHSYSIDIGTLENPGWSLTIDLAETRLSGVQFGSVKLDRSEKDWLSCEIRDNQFIGHCGATNLTELLNVFKELASGDQEQTPEA